MPDSSNIEFIEDFDSALDDIIQERGLLSGRDAKYLQQPAPNIIEWVTGVNFGNVPTTFGHSRQYQIMRDVFMLRCPLCNSSKPQDANCWGKSRMYLESETLLAWDVSEQDFVCPRCRSTQRELIQDDFFQKYNEMIILAGMRSGKSYLGAHVGGYFEHMLITWGMQGQGHLQRMLQQEKSEWFECTFAASTAEQAQNTIYAKYREMRKNSPWIKKYVSWVKKAQKDQLAVGKDPWKYKTNEKAIEDGWLQVRFNRIASDSAGVAGRTRIFASIDEWARLINSDGTRSALELYAVMNNSLKTVRGAVDLNGLPPFLGFMANVTSPIAQDDPAMLRYNMAHTGELPTCYGWKGPTWEFNPFMPRKVFDDDYIRDAVIAERDFGANPPLSATPYIEDPQRFWKCISWDATPMVDYSLDYITDPTDKKYVGATAEECLVDPVNSYMIFADAGKSWDAFSLVIGRPKWVSGDTAAYAEEQEAAAASAGRVQPQSNLVVGMDPREMIQVKSMAGLQEAALQDEVKRARRVAGAAKTVNDSHYGEMLVTEVVSVFRIVPTQEREIWFESILDIIRFLKDKIRIVGFGCDTWNSTSTVQAIRNMGIPAKEITLKIDDFMAFKNLAYNGRVSMLPPTEADQLNLLANGTLKMNISQINMSGPGIALVELLKLSRSEDLKKVFSAKKGLVRGQDSDDVARCVIGLNHLVQTSVVDAKAQDAKKQQTLQRLKSMENPLSGSILSSDGRRS